MWSYEDQPHELISILQHDSCSVQFLDETDFELLLILILGKYWSKVSQETWDSCPYKEAVAAAVIILILGFSSNIARIWAGKYMHFIIFSKSPVDYMHALQAPPGTNLQLHEL